MAKHKPKGNQKKRTKCPVPLDLFLENAKPLKVVIGDNAAVASPKEFSTGSYGWYTSVKGIVDIGGIPCSVQIGLNVTLVGSKPETEPKE